MLFEIMNSATEDDIPRLLLSIQASRSLLKSRLYCETSTVSGKKKKLIKWNWSTFISQTSLLLPSFPLFSPWPIPTYCRRHSHQNAIILYTKLTKKKAFNKSKMVCPLCNGGCERNVTIEAALTSLSMVSHVTASVRFCLHSIYSVDLRLISPVTKNKTTTHKYSLSN